MAQDAQSKEMASEAEVLEGETGAVPAAGAAGLGEVVGEEEEEEVEQVEEHEGNAGSPAAAAAAAVEGIASAPVTAADGVVDVLGDGGVRVRYLEAGSGEAVEEGSQVTLQYSGFVISNKGAVEEAGDDSDDSDDASNVPFMASPDEGTTFALGHGAVPTGTVLEGGPILHHVLVISHYNTHAHTTPPIRRVCMAGLEHAIKTLHVGDECSVFLTPEYAFGAHGVPDKVPADSHIRYHVKLLATNSKERAVWELTDEVRIFPHHHNWAPLLAQTKSTQLTPTHDGTPPPPPLPVLGHAGKAAKRSRVPHLRQ